MAIQFTPQMMASAAPQSPQIAAMQAAAKLLPSSAMPEGNPAKYGSPPPIQTDPFGFTSAASSIGRFIVMLGPPFSGKTTACLTFPNPRFLNLDNKLPAGTQCVPFHDPKFCDSLVPRTSPAQPPNRKDAILSWLLRNVHRLSADTTLILDSFSGLSDAFHLQAETVEDVGTSKAGNRALLKVFGAKLSYLDAVFALLKLSPARIVVTVHTMPEYNEKGEPTGAVKPFCTGSFSDKICSYATDVLRSYIDIDPNTGRPRVDPTTGEITGYRWRLKPDRICPLVGTLIPNPPDSIRARWSDLEQLISAPSSAASPTAAGN